MVQSRFVVIINIEFPQSEKKILDTWALVDKKEIRKTINF